MVIILPSVSYVFPNALEKDVYEIVYVKYAVEAACSLIPLATSVWLICIIIRCMHNRMNIGTMLVRVILSMISGMITAAYVVSNFVKGYAFDASSAMMMLGMAFITVIVMRYIANEKLLVVDWIVYVAALALGISSQIDRIVHEKGNAVFDEKPMKMVVTIVAMLVFLWNVLFKSAIMGQELDEQKENKLDASDRKKQKRRGECLVKCLLNYLIMAMAVVMVAIETGNDFVATYIRRYMSATDLNELAV
ncbi:hypothetical protein HK407_14g18800 [Ordospora pajunii]|uniref:uncharacterized protein n=1 Tax=Ordospora pajunii TaxID=3039483 RepID=UPI0029526306|nr:uncharacterized protein HK407_14g18800 [Ordospora pajunii]KAH9410537.1 hypothetical protein HK407_14g18800 [Ordospora pajunii]